MGKERAAPGGLDLSDVAADDVGRQTQHQMLAAVEQTGLQRQGGATALHLHQIPLHHAARRLPGHLRQGRLMAVQVLDGGLQPLGGLQRIELRLHDDLTLHQAQPPAEADHRRGLCLLGGGQLVVDCSQFAFDIIQKSQEPTSYYPNTSLYTPTITVPIPRMYRESVIPNDLDKNSR